MTISSRFCFVLFMIAQLVCIHVSGQSTKEKIAVKDFCKIKTNSRVNLSPGGKLISYMGAYNGKKNVFVEDMVTKEKKRITSYTDRNVGGYYWLTDSLMVIRIDNNGDEDHHLYLYDLVKNTQKDLTPYTSPGCEYRSFKAPLHIITEMTKDSVSGVYEININTLTTRELAREFMPTSSWVLDNNDIVRLAEGYDGEQRVVYYRKNASDSFRLLLRTEAEDQLLPLCFEADNNNFYAFSNLGRDKFALVLFDPEQKKETVVFADSTYDVNSENTMCFDSKTKKLTHFTYDTWKQTYVFIDEKVKSEYAPIMKKFPRHNIFVINKDERGQYLLDISSDKIQGQYYIYSSATGSFKQVLDNTPSVPESQLVEIRPISYTSRDGLVIQGYIAVPDDNSVKKRPLVAIAHGGPWTRDPWDYNTTMQLLANRGYIAFYMDFRGSRGYGKKHYASSFKAWDKMNDDIADGVNWLIKKGIADSSRVAIMGASWGGFAANYSMAFYPSMYKCGVAIVGPSNIFSFYQNLTHGLAEYQSVFNKLIGNPKIDSSYLAEISPLLHVNNIKGPMLIWQGKKDPRVPWTESQQMADALKLNGIPVQIILKEDEGHNISDEANRIEFNEALDNFFAKYL